MISKFLKKYWYLLLLVYFGFVIVGTMIVPGRSPFEWIHILVPPGRIRALLVYPLQHHHPVVFAQLFNFADTLMNIFLFFPLGIAIFLSFRTIFLDSIKKILIIALLLGAILSIGIEIFQSTVPNRIPSLSDVIANTGGTVFGCYLVYFRKEWKKIKTKKSTADSKFKT